MLTDSNVCCHAGKLYGKINWRIPTDGGDFLERSTVQVFRQQVCARRHAIIV